MYTVENFVVKFAFGGQSLSIHPAGDSVSAAEFHPSVLAGPELAKLFNAMAEFARDDAMEAAPEAVKRFSDKLSALKRVGALQLKIAEHLRSQRAAAPVVVVEPIVEVKSLKSLPPKVTCVAKKKDGSTYVVGQPRFTDNMRITNIAAEAGRASRVSRWHLYREGMTVSEFFAEAKVWMRTQPKYAGKRDIGQGGLNNEIRSWLSTDAKKTDRAPHRITIS